MGFKMADQQSAGFSRSKSELEVKLDCGKPFRAKPFTKHVGIRCGCLGFSVTTTILFDALHGGHE